MAIRPFPIAQGRVFAMLETETGKEARPCPAAIGFTALRPVHPELRQGGGRGCYHRSQPGRHPAVRGARPSGAGRERPVLPDPVRPPRGRVHPHGRAGCRGGLVHRPVLCGLFRHLRPEPCLAPGGTAPDSGETMFRPEGVTLDLGDGPRQYVAFERSNSMSRMGRLSFLRADLWETVRRRIMLDLELGRCQLSKLYAYNGLMLSTGAGWRASRSTGPPGHCGGQPRPAAQRQGHHRGGCGRHGQCAALPPGGAGGGLFRHRV